jgi:hypothetical protein
MRTHGFAADTTIFHTGTKLSQFHPPLGSGFAIFGDNPGRLLGTGLRRMAGNAATHQSPSSFFF